MYAGGLPSSAFPKENDPGFNSTSQSTCESNVDSSGMIESEL